MWQVSLLSVPVERVWGVGYFPRKFAYKKDAEALALKVKLAGGAAVVRKVKK